MYGSRVTHGGGRFPEPDTTNVLALQKTQGFEINISLHYKVPTSISKNYSVVGKLDVYRSLKIRRELSTP